MLFLYERVLRESVTRLYHGSPCGKFDTFKGPAFFTPEPRVAREYANGVLMTGRCPPGTDRKPVVMEVEVDLGRAFDMRKDEHRRLYDELRAAHNADPETDDEDRLPKIGREGFIAPRTGLPQFSFLAPLLQMLRAAGRDFDSIWVDEGSQGASVYVIDPGRVRVLGVEDVR